MKFAQVEWGVTLFLIGYHLALLIGLPFYFIYNSPAGGLYIAAVILLYLSGLAITMGYHRFYAHSTFKTNKLVEVILLFFGSMATQGSALRWACDHRNHHAYVDTDRDPYSVKKGFMHAHVLWLFRKTKPINQKVVADLYRNKLLVFQDKFYVPLMLLTNTTAFLFVGYLFNDYLGAFVITWGLRLFFLHHFTWFINSLAHTWGSQSFSQEHSAVDNYLISLLTFGEGYHNYHHTFANDYRNGTKWYHFDPTKWLLWSLSKCHLVSGLKKVSSIRIKERMVLESKNEIQNKITESWLTHKKKLLEDVVEKTTEDLMNKLADLRQLITEYQSYKKSKVSKDTLKKLQLKIKRMKKNLKSDWKSWQKFSKAVMRLKPISP